MTHLLSRLEQTFLFCFFSFLCLQTCVFFSLLCYSTQHSSFHELSSFCVVVLWPVCDVFHFWCSCVFGFSVFSVLCSTGTMTSVVFHCWGSCGNFPRGSSSSHHAPLPSPLITLRDRNQQRGETESTLRMSPPHNDFDATCWKQMIKSPSTKSRRVHVREFYYVCFSWNFVVVKSQRRNLKKCKIMVTKKREGTECRNCCGNLSPGSFPSHIPLLTVSFYITSVTHRDKYRHRHRNIHTHRCSP